jgi:zona occludens toxin (predicted ATPase)
MQAVIINKGNPQPTTRTSIRVLNIALWILQLLMAAHFFWHGQFMAFPLADMVARFCCSSVGRYNTPSRQKGKGRPGDASGVDVSERAKMGRPASAASGGAVTPAAAGLPLAPAAPSPTTASLTR